MLLAALVGAPIGSAALFMPARLESDAHHAVAEHTARQHLPDGLPVRHHVPRALKRDSHIIRDSDRLALVRRHTDPLGEHHRATTGQLRSKPCLGR